MESASVLLEMLERIQSLEKQVKELQDIVKQQNSVEFDSMSIVGCDCSSVKSCEVDIKKRDTTKYLFNGVVYPKNRLVLAVVKDYVENNRVSFDELKKIFHPSLQGSIGVFERVGTARNRQDYRIRFFIAENDIITLTDCCIYVCNQWGILNIPRFLSRAKNLGYKIQEI